MRIWLVVLLCWSFHGYCFGQSTTILPRILQHPNSVKIDPLDILNSPLRETNLSITPDGKYLYFMSSRGGESWSRAVGMYKNQPRFDGDIYFSEKDQNGNWTTPQNLQAINTSSGEDEPFVTPDGQQVIFQSWRSNWTSTGGCYYQARLQGNKWTQIKGLGDGITGFFQTQFEKFGGFATDGMSMSADLKTFVVAANQNYSGSMDLYWSKKDVTGKWSFCKKMPISTTKDERSVFFAADNRTIYFASNGYGGFGGLDIFKAVLDEEGNAVEILNIGAPFNTEEDDYGFVLTASGESAYFVREGDIYFADLIHANDAIRPSPILLITGNIVGCDNEPIEAQISLKNTKNEVVGTSYTNTRGKGEFVLLLSEKLENPSFYSYQIDFEDSTLASHIEKIQIEPFKNYTTHHLNTIQIQHCDKQKRFIQTIYFDFDEDKLTPQSEKQLLTQLETLQKASKIILIGHTDNKGGLAYNYQLSDKRIFVVKDFLMQHSISATSIQSTANGETQPIQSNESEKGRSQNRRVEIWIE